MNCVAKVLMQVVVYSPEEKLVSLFSLLDGKGPVIASTDSILKFRNQIRPSLGTYKC